MQRVDSLEKTLMLEEIGGRRRRERQRMRRLDGITDLMDVSLGEFRELGTTEDEMVGWHHQLNGREFEKTLGDGEGQGSLECCRPCIHKESYMT